MNKEQIQTIINEAEYEILAFDRTSKVVSKKLINALKQLALCNVSNRRELLTAFLQYGKQRHYTPLTEEQIQALVNDFEGSL